MTRPTRTERRPVTTDRPRHDREHDDGAFAPEGRHPSMNRAHAPNRRDVIAGASRLAVLGVAGASGLAAPGLVRRARAGRAVGGVVELFTSQGCSSCPPADAVLGELIANGEAIGLAHHVDYWDYLGWADPLATKEGTQRQYAYATTFNRRGVYTPQAVVNGREHHVGSRGTAIRQALAEHDASRLAPGLDVAIEATGGTARVSVAPGSPRPTNAVAAKTVATETVVTVMHYVETHTEAIGRGENRGREITYHHPVLSFETLGRWTGGAIEMAVDLPPLPAPGGMAVLVQEQLGRAPGAILGAAALTRSG